MSCKATVNLSILYCIRNIQYCLLEFDQLYRFPNKCDIILSSAVKRRLEHLNVRFGRHTRSSDLPQLLILVSHQILPFGDERVKIEAPGMTNISELFGLHLNSSVYLISIIIFWARNL